jgi:TetR/AcrR family transcriptional regulator, transcriptional repressor for nem operon
MRTTEERAGGQRVGGRQRTAATRERILTVAAELFRGHGIDAVGVDAIMRAAGLTHGGFYAHFASKEALVAEVLASSLAHSAGRWEWLSQTREPAEALRRIVHSYLDAAHVAAREQGCVLASLGPEMARREQMRPAITASIRRMLEAIRRTLPGRRRVRAVEALSGMVGAVVLARLCDDPDLAQEFLAAGRRVAGCTDPVVTRPICDTAQPGRA